MPVILSPPETPQRDYPLLPSPFVGISKEFKRLGDGRVVGSDMVYTFQGTLLPKKGNPFQDSTSSTASVTFENTTTGPAWVTTYSDPADDPVASTLTNDQLLEVLMEKQRLIREKLSYEGLQIKIYSLDGSLIHDITTDAPIDIAFDTDRLAIQSEYTFTIRQPINSVNQDGWNWYINSATDTIDITERDQALVTFDSDGNVSKTRKIFDVTRNISAVGARAYNTSGSLDKGFEAWQQASGWVWSNGQAIGTNFASTVLSTANDDLPSNELVPSTYTKYNHSFVENIDKSAGTYGITETFVYTSGDPVVEDVTFSINRDESALTSIGIEGSIQGLNTIAGTGNADAFIDKYTSATAYWTSIQGDLYKRALKASDLSWLNPVPLSKAVGKNPSQGAITYNYSYDDRAPNIITGAISENISINDTYPGQNVAEIPVIGRNQPVLQYLNSRSAYKRSLQIDVVMSGTAPSWTTGVPTTGDIRTTFFNSKPSITASSDFEKIYDAINPANDPAVVGKVFYSAPAESWNPKTGSYTYSVEWTFEK